MGPEISRSMQHTTPRGLHRRWLARKLARKEYRSKEDLGNARRHRGIRSLEKPKDRLRECPKLKAKAAMKLPAIAQDSSALFIHNDSRAALSTKFPTGTKGSKRPASLLTLPGELRNRIYRLALIAPKQPILVTASTRLPGILHASHQLRKESGSIYFSENMFEVDVMAYDGTLAIAFNRLLARHLRHVRNFTMQLRGPGSWRNLTHWLYEFHVNGVIGLVWRLGDERHLQVAGAAFDLVGELLSLPWCKVEVVLEDFHRAVAAGDPGWI